MRKDRPILRQWRLEPAAPRQYGIGLRRGRPQGLGKPSFFGYRWPIPRKAMEAPCLGQRRDPVRPRALGVMARNPRGCTSPTAARLRDGRPLQSKSPRRAGARNVRGNHVPGSAGPDTGWARQDSKLTGGTALRSAKISPGPHASLEVIECPTPISSMGKVSISWPRSA